MPHPSAANTAPTVSTWLATATAALQNASIPSARLDAEVILAHTIRKPRTYLHAHGDEPLDSRQQEIANARIDLRLDRVPIAYIIGHKEFYGRRFKVTTATLIPRPESEVLIELLNETLATMSTQMPLVTNEPLRLLDVGTGSGALGITAKLEHPELASQLDVTLIDTSRHALAVAKDNATILHADVDIVQSDLLTSYPLTATIIMANLPYVDPSWQRSPETDHEPAEALFADNHGLALIYKLIAQTKEKLIQGGTLILEADPTQHELIKTEATRYGLVLVTQKEYGLAFNKVT